MMDFGVDNPYKTLGWHLKFAREQLSESLDEVSGAVEIESDILQKIEQGEQRPSEEILLLLISHLGLEDSEAASLWELAGYTSRAERSAAGDHKQITVAVIPYDMRIIYTDMTNVTVNKYGVVMNFIQSGGHGIQSLPVARVGMSKKQALQVIDALQKGLASTKNHPVKYLPYPKNHGNTNK